MQKLLELLVAFKGVIVFGRNLVTENYQDKETGLESWKPTYSSKPAMYLF